MVAEGPMPGSTPMIVPRKQPMNVYQRLIGCRQTAKAFRMWVSVSMAPSERQEAQDALRQAHVELDEQNVGPHGEQRGGEDVDEPLAAVEPRHQAEQVDRRGDDEAERIEDRVIDRGPDDHARQYPDDDRVEHLGSRSLR